jgi:pyruvate,water dikinase
MAYIKRFDEIGAADLAEVGGKGANLGELTGAGLPVPDGVVLTTAAYRAYVAADGVLPEDVAAAVREAYREVGGAVAVRSSATAEDQADASFAGQHDTFLNVRDADGVQAAVLDCWASLWTDRAKAYRAERGIEPDAVALAVVIQRMVPAESSGVLFTANPANGRRDQVVVSAAWGLGESVVGGLVSTDDHVVDKATGRLVSRRVADQAEMTVYSDGAGTEQRAVPVDLGGKAVLDDAAVAELTRLGVRIEEHFGVPQDVEWARAEGRFHIVQSRPITALPEPTADVPTDWTPPDPDGWYFRASIVEQMPDPLTPLFADMIDGAVSRSISTLVTQAFAPGLLQPGDIALPTVNGYAYYFYRTGIMRRMILGLPTAARSLTADRTRGGIRGWRERAHPQYRRIVEEWAARNPAALLDAELLDGVRELLVAACEYYTAVQSIIPLAATGELAFRAFYDRLVRRAGDPPGQTFLVGFDSQPIRAEKSLYDLAVAARTDPALVEAITGDRAELRRALRDGDPPARRERGYAELDRSKSATTSFSTEVGPDPEVWRGWRAAFQEHLDRYGHTVYNLDFADPVPADDPDPLLDAVGFHLTGGADPHARQRATADRRDRQTRVIRTVLDPARRAVFDGLLRFAQETGPVREDALGDMGLAWPAMRRMLLELGDRLVASGVLTDRADVFWLRHDELLAGRADAAAIADRKALWRGRRQAIAPQVLPVGSWMDRLLTRVLPAADQHQAGPTIRGVGVGAGSGRITAPARVLSGPADFAAMRPGEVLVARITTPAWTPLFAMAAAVVTDVGGPLSHSSIVAREYGIPAVLGTGAATNRIRTGQQVRFDGDAGTVTLLDELDSAGAADLPAPDHRRLRSALLGGAAGWALIAVLRRRRKPS